MNGDFYLCLRDVLTHPRPQNTMLKTESEIIDLQIDGESRIPKYRQIINSIIDDIKRGSLAVGQRIPSINEISEEYYLSRDTVEKAYGYLKEKQIIVSARGKGYYVARADLSSKINVLFLLNKLSAYKLQIYNAFVSGLGSVAQVDLAVYHGDPCMLHHVLEEATGRYDNYVLMPHFTSTANGSLEQVLDVLRRIPEDKLLILDNDLPDLGREVAAVFQDFRMDLYEALQDGQQRLSAYKKLVLVFPKRTAYPYPIEIVHGFKQFCHDFKFEFSVLDEIRNDKELTNGAAYITIEESDLVNLIKIVRDRNLKLGEDIGVISYNDTPLKDLLGISVISTDFKAMGETAAYMILRRKKEKVKNVFSFIDRKSA
jgi:DNA-binding transcriptional regulator YhcF (GntR family)